MQSHIHLNDFTRQWQQVGSGVLHAIERVGQSGWLILGKEVELFERRLADYTGAAQVVGCANGLDAIEIGLRIAGLQEGDRVITTPLSAFATTLAIVRAGGVPVFVDVDESGLLDLDEARTYLADNPTSARYLLPVHLFGHCIDLHSLRELRDRFALTVVEDCAQAIGASSGGLKIGSVGQLSALSFYPTKNLGCLGDGGALLTDNDEFARRAKALRNYGQTEKYVHRFIGLNSRLDELQAAVMTDALLPILEQTTARRREIALVYTESIAHPKLTIPPCPSASSSVYHLFPVLVAGDRQAFRAHLQASGIETVIHYPSIIPDQPALNDLPITVIGNLAMARKFAEQEVSLPIHPYLRDHEIERVITACNSWNLE